MIFSTTEKPAPTAKPEITASSLKPIRLNRKRVTMTIVFKRLLDPRRDEAAVIGEADRQGVEEHAAERIGRQRGNHPHEQQAAGSPRWSSA